MENLHIAILAIVVLVLIFLYWISSSYYAMYDDMLSGMWRADPDWAMQADLDGMLLYIGNAEGWWGESRKGYLIMHANDQIIAAKQLELNVSTGLHIVPKKTLTYWVTLTDLGESEGLLPDEGDSSNVPLEDIMPSELQMEIGVSSGRLILYGDEDGEEIQYAKLFKDAVATDTSRARGE